MSYLIRTIIIHPKLLKEIEKKGLLERLQKAKKILLLIHTPGLDFKQRKPKHENVWSFRLSKQRRIFGYFKDTTTFVITTLDNHQNY